MSQSSTESKRRYRETHREAIAARKRQHYIENRDKYLMLERDRQYRKRYGITLADYNRLLTAQDGQCAICGATQGGAKGQCFAVDHCHATGRVRGLLCIKCNARIGWLGWYSDHQARIARYLGEPIC